jgi:TolB-like protein
MKKILIILIVLALCLCSGSSIFAQENVLSRKVSELADKLAFAVEGHVVGVSGETVYINLGQASGIVEGIKFEVVRLDKDHPFKMDDKIIGYPESEVGQIEITRVRKEMSLAKITNKVMDIQEGDKTYQEMKKVTRVAITEFTYGDEFNDFTRNVQDILYTNLIQRGMTVVEREKMEQVLKELGNTFSGMLDSSTAAQIGKMLGVEAIVVGTVADMGNSVDLRARLVDVEKGAAITAAQVDVVKDPTITKILSNGRRPAIYGKKVSETTKDGKAVSGELSKITVRNLIIEMIGCKRYRDGVNCNLLITNNDQDRNIDVYYYGSRSKTHPCRLFDSHGNTYWADTIKMANKSYSFDYFQTFGSKHGSLLFISGVPVKVVYYISGDLLSKANSLSLFEFWLAEGDTNFKIQFRDIPITE